MDHKALNSTNLKSCAWSPDKTLEIKFVRGKTYAYINVPYVVYEGLLRAQSAGGYFDLHIRGRYSFKIMPADARRK